MPKYIRRDMEKLVLELSSEYSSIMITGPRQVGKSTMLRHIMGKDRKVVSLDDVEERNEARLYPKQFIERNRPPLIIDEVQYAPELFSYIKLAIDNGAPPGSYWLTGSQSFQLMRLAGESMAGRVALLHMCGLSQNEIHGFGDSSPFLVEYEDVLKRRDLREKASDDDIFKRIFDGAFPAYISGMVKKRDVFFRSYIETCMRRDIGDEIRGVDEGLFMEFMRSVACRIGQPLNVHALACDVKISDDTARRWLGVLEKSDIIFYLYPYSNNLLTRTIKYKKLYFFDTGLAAYLTKFSSAKVLSDSPYSGAFLENYIVSEIRKTYFNNGEECYLNYYRDTLNNEIDLVMEDSNGLHPVEVKKSVSPTKEMVKSFSVLKKASVPVGTGAVVCMRDDLSTMSDGTILIPAWTI